MYRTCALVHKDIFCKVMAPHLPLRQCSNCRSTLTRDRCSYRVEDNGKTCDRPICHSCKIIVFRMWTNDPYRCDWHKIIRNPLHVQMLKKASSLSTAKADQVAEAAVDAASSSDDLTSSNYYLQNPQRVRGFSVAAATTMSGMTTTTSAARRSEYSNYHHIKGGNHKMPL